MARVGNINTIPSDLTSAGFFVLLEVVGNCMTSELTTLEFIGEYECGNFSNHLFV